MEGAWRHTVGHAAGRRRGHRENAQDYTEEWVSAGGNAWGTHGRSHGGMPGWKLRETHGRCMETHGGAHGVRIGRHQRNAQDYTEEWGGLMGERMGDARKVTRPHARMDIGA